MARIDIREEDEQGITEILISDELSLLYEGSGDIPRLYDQEDDYYIRGRDLENIIKALRKAQEMGWFE